jgi:hypothetical protein
MVASKSLLTRKAKRAIRFGHQCANGKRGNKDYRVNVAMSEHLCIQIVGDEDRFGGPARDLIMRAWELRSAELNPGVK